MSKEYLVLFVDEPGSWRDVDGQKAEVFMRFTEEPTEDFLSQLARQNRGRRVYCLMGASSWFSADGKVE